MERAKTNKVFVIGTVEEVNTLIRTSGNGKEYINGKIVVKTEVDGKPTMVELKVLAFAKNKNGEDNKMFLTYKTLDGMRGKRVKITGELREGSMIKQDGGSVIHFNEIYLKFINPARTDDIDCSTFEFSGFVVKPICERRNKDDEILGYRIEVAQANYDNTNIQVIRFDIDKNDVNIAQAIEANYLPGATVSFNGTLSYSSHVETRTEEVAFGEPVVKSYVQTEKSYRITSGQEAFPEDGPDTYRPDEIKKYIEAYKAADVARLEKQVADSAPASTPMGEKTRVTSLL